MIYGKVNEVWGYTRTSQPGGGQGGLFFFVRIILERVQHIIRREEEDKAKSIFSLQF